MILLKDIYAADEKSIIWYFKDKKIAPVGAIFYELTDQLITSYHACLVVAMLFLL
jgi:hypothetical protein